MNSRVSIILAFVVLAAMCAVAVFAWLQRKETMRAPKYIAVFTCVLLAFTLLQGFMWPARPEPGWHPSWWQLKTWAAFGEHFGVIAMIPMLLAQEIGLQDIRFVNIVTGALAYTIGFFMEFVSVYALVYFPTRFLFRRTNDFRTHKTVG
jgi:hypothetical protein